MKNEKMRSLLGVVGKTLKVLLCILISAVVIFFVARLGVKIYYSHTPKGGINESFYADINGTKQWINIYGKNKDNPVLLYLHGGPGGATSAYDYKITREWADVYTVVTWDQRAAGKTWLKEKDTTPITLDLMMQDGLEMTEFLRSYLGKEKISIVGYSWGSIYGAKLVLAHPEYYDTFIGTGMVVDFQENEKRFWAAAKEWAKGNEEDEQMIEKCASGEISGEDPVYLQFRTEMIGKYGYGSNAVKFDFNPLGAMFFCPHYNIIDLFKYMNIMGGTQPNLDFIESEEFNNLSVKDQTKYEVSYYNINGDMDYQANFEMAKEYFDKVQAPNKKYFLMKDMTHVLLVARPGEFSDYIHEIATLEENK